MAEADRRSERLAIIGMSFRRSARHRQRRTGGDFYGNCCFDGTEKVRFRAGRRPGRPVDYPPNRMAATQVPAGDPVPIVVLCAFRLQERLWLLYSRMEQARELSVGRPGMA